MKKYVIASFIGGIPAGTEFEESRWPLHVTLMRTIHSDCEAQELVNTLVETLQDQKPFILIGKSEELFGPEHDRPVTELALTEEMTALNALLKAKFSKLTDQSVPDKYPTYRPHVTRQDDQGIAVGDTVAIDSASIVLTEGDSRKVLCTVRF